jgi:hypothetical protein
LLKSKAVFLPVRGLNREKFELDFSSGKYHYLKKFFNKSRFQRRSFKFCFDKSIIEFAQDIDNNFLKRIEYDSISRRFILDYYSAPDLFLYCHPHSFSEEFLKVTNQVNFREIVMGIITAFDAILLKNYMTPNLLSVLNNQDRYRFFFYLTEAFMSKELEKLRKDFGFYLLRWLRVRIILSLSLNELKESINAYLSLLIDPEEKWIWKFVDVENEVKEILKHPKFKEIVILELKDLKARLFQWIASRYSITLNLTVLK